MKKIADSYLYLHIRQKIGEVVYKLIQDLYDVTHFTPSNFQFPL